MKFGGYSYFSRVILGCAALLSGLATTGPLAFATPSITRLLETTTGRFLLLETAEGNLILDRLGGISAGCTGPCREQAIARFKNHLEHPDMLELRTELETRMNRIHDEVNFRETALSLDNMTHLRSLAARELRITPEWRLEKAVKNMETLRANERMFIRTEGDPILSSKIGEKTALTKPGFRQKVVDYVKKLKSCVAKMPPKAATHNKNMYMFRQLAIDEAMTVGGKIIAAGSGAVAWKDLPADMVFEAMNSLGATKISQMKGSTMARWFRLSLFGVGGSSVDAVVYYFSPLKADHNGTNEDAAFARFKYNAVWDTAYAPVHILIQDLFEGLDCLYPAGAGHAGVVALQLGSNLGLNVAYYGIRNEALGVGLDD